MHPYNARTMADEPTPTDPSTEAYANLTRTLHANHIDPAHEADVAKQVAALRDAIKLVAAVPLTNADEPEPRFAAYRADA